MQSAEFGNGIVIGTISDEEIGKRAFEIYERRIGLGLPGDADSDWRIAEELVSAQKFYHVIGRDARYNPLQLLLLDRNTDSSL